MTETMTSTGPLVEAERFRRSFRGVAGCVAVILAEDGGGGVRGITCTSAVSLSINPPLLVMCLDDKTRMRELIEAAGRFSTNYVAGDYGWMARAFSERNRSLDHVAPAVVPGRTRVPTLAYGTTSVLECDVEAIHPGGDHWILVGVVRHARFQADAPSLLYRAGTYGSFAAQPASSGPGPALPPSTASDATPATTASTTRGEQ